VRRGRSWDDWPPPSRPLPVAGGVRSRSRGAFAKNWWGERFLAALAALDPDDGPSRLARGRSYARRGQVMNVDVAPGRVDARVQGSRPRPYTVRIEFTALPEAVWRAAASALGERAAELAALLGATLTPGVEEAFRAAGASLLPARNEDLATECNCPDWANPCKHVAAVYYLVAEELDRDPFLLLRLRGVEREAFVAAATEAGAPRDEEAESAAAALSAAAAPAAVDPRAAALPLPVAPDAFWGAPAPAPVLHPVPALVDAPFVRGLGEVAFWRGEEGIVAFAARALASAAGVAAAALADAEALFEGANGGQDGAAPPDGEASPPPVKGGARRRRSPARRERPRTRSRR
jgi:uncharacterized Zn finger protein